MGIEIASKNYIVTIKSNQKLYGTLLGLRDAATSLYKEYFDELIDPYKNNGNNDSIYNLILMNSSKYKIIPPVTASIIAALASMKVRAIKKSEELEGKTRIPVSFIPLVFEIDDLKIEEGKIILPDNLGAVELPDFLCEMVVPTEIKELVDEEGNSLPVDPNNIEFLSLVQLRFTFFNERLEMDCQYREAIYT